MIPRWEGIARNLKAWRGQYPSYADCSSIATWWLWQGLDHYGVRDVVNGTGWQSGYTGTMLGHGREVVDSGNWLRGDLFIYGSGFPGQHVTMYLGSGFVASHGSEPGPFKLRWNYRSDLMQVRRYI
jgi:cell wall-associated NlpC family hydrolase